VTSFYAKRNAYKEEELLSEAYGRFWQVRGVGERMRAVAGVITKSDLQGSSLFDDAAVTRKLAI
jgi:hypothetical protein